MDRTSEKGYWEFIWDKFKAGDRRAFELIYIEFVQALFSYGSRITQHHALLEDAIQDTFLAVYIHGGSLCKPESLEFYLYKTLRHIIIRKLKEKYPLTHPNHFPESFDLKFSIEESVLEEVYISGTNLWTWDRLNKGLPGKYWDPEMTNSNAYYYPKQTIINEEGEPDYNGELTYEFINCQDRAFYERMYFLPIPREEIERTTLLQNPGYD